MFFLATVNMRAAPPLTRGVPRGTGRQRAGARSGHHVGQAERDPASRGLVRNPGSALGGRVVSSGGFLAHLVAGPAGGP